MIRLIVSTSAFVFLVQVIGFFSLPFIGAIAGANAFGEYTKAIAILSVVQVFVSLKGEYLYYVLEKENFTSINSLLFFISIISLFVSFLLYFMFGRDLRFVSFGFFVVSCIIFEYRIQENVCLGRFAENNINRVLRALLFPVAFFIFNQFGLYDSNAILVSYSIASLTPLFFMRYDFRALILGFGDLMRCKREIFSNAINMVPSHFLKQYSLGAIFILAAYFDASNEQVGIYAMFFKFVVAPASIIALGISDIFRKRICDNISIGYSLYIKILLVTLPISLLSVLFILSYGDYFIVYVIGGEWSSGDKFIPALCILFFTSVCLSPVTYTYLVLKKQKYDLIWQLINGLFISVVLIVMFLLSSELEYIVNLFAVIYSFNTFLSFAFCMYLLRKERGFL